MTNMRELVHSILINDVAVQSCLVRNLVNTRGLAKYIIDNYKLDASIDSVISAIRRFNPDCVYHSHESRFHELLANAPITTTSGLVVVDIRGKNDIKKCLGQLNSIIDIDKGDHLRMIKGNAFLRMIIDEHNLPKLQEFLDTYDDVNIVKDLVELSIKTNSKEDLDKTKGVMARVANDLAMNGVNLIELLVSSPNILVHVKTKYYKAAHNSLLKLSGL